MVIYLPKSDADPSVQTCVSIPARLRAFAREEGINLSGTLRAALEREYNTARAMPASNLPDRSSNHTR